MAAVPDSLVGYILGKKGATMKEIQQRSGAKVMLSARYGSVILLASPSNPISLPSLTPDLIRRRRNLNQLMLLSEQ
jgi:hypothetical protein